jgi:hypothetical protein
VSRRLLIAAAVAYAAGAVATFGQAAAGAEPAHNQLQRECVESRSTVVCLRAEDDVPPAIIGMAAALAWPLYWSWELAE